MKWIKNLKCLNCGKDIAFLTVAYAKDKPLMRVSISLCKDCVFEESEKGRFFEVDVATGLLSPPIPIESYRKHLSPDDFEATLVDEVRLPGGKTARLFRITHIPTHRTEVTLSQTESPIEIDKRRLLSFTIGTIKNTLKKDLT